MTVIKNVSFREPTVPNHVYKKAAALCTRQTSQPTPNFSMGRSWKKLYAASMLSAAALIAISHFSNSSNTPLQITYVPTYEPTSSNSAFANLYKPVYPIATRDNTSYLPNPMKSLTGRLFVINPKSFQSDSDMLNATVTCASSYLNATPQFIQENVSHLIDGAKTLWDATTLDAGWMQNLLSTAFNYPKVTAFSLASLMYTSVQHKKDVFDFLTGTSKDLKPTPPDWYTGFGRIQNTLAVTLTQFEQEVSDIWERATEENQAEYNRFLSAVNEVKLPEDKLKEFYKFAVDYTSAFYSKITRDGRQASNVFSDLIDLLPNLNDKVHQTLVKISGKVLSSDHGPLKAAYSELLEKASFIDASKFCNPELQVYLANCATKFEDFLKNANYMGNPADPTGVQAAILRSALDLFTKGSEEFVSGRTSATPEI